MARGPLSRVVYTGVISTSDRRCWCILISNCTENWKPANTVACKGPQWKNHYHNTTLSSSSVPACPGTHPTLLYVPIITCLPPHIYFIILPSILIIPPPSSAPPSGSSIVANWKGCHCHCHVHCRGGPASAAPHLAHGGARDLHDPGVPRNVHSGAGALVGFSCPLVFADLSGPRSSRPGWAGLL